ncbi:MAG: tRNA lysidine(34) synthetase TilS [Bradyrhizobiaceae bacterium]|nr:tRNA lysidine(34) synthetase TilS [Bradyrhizobiaceae bacterium]
MSAAEPAGAPVAGRELASLFSSLEHFRRVLLAVSGGPDSTALLVLAQRWRKARKRGPELFAATVDHRLRRESKTEAAAVGKLARSLGVPHETLIWSGKKPKRGVQEAAREARYALLVRLARKLDADAIVTAHTLDDQAETLLMRLARGSGLAGLGGIRPKSRRDGITLLRPLLGVPKARLIATLRKARVSFAEDPSNVDPRFLRPRLRAFATAFADLGFDPARLARVAARLARADAAIEAVIDELQTSLAEGGWPEGGPIILDAGRLFGAPDEISLRLLGRAIARAGNEGPVELAKLEALHVVLKEAAAGGKAVRRTLAGAAVGLAKGRLVVERAPARRAGQRRRV